MRDSLMPSPKHRNGPPILIILTLLVMGAGAVSARTLTLAQALELAFANSPSIQQVRFALETSEHNLKAQQASLKSQFNLSVTPYQFFKSREFNDLFSQYYDRKQTSRSARLTVTQPIKWTDGTLSLIEEFDRRKASSSFIDSPEQRSYGSSLYLNFNQPLFTYNRTQMRLKELELALENARLDYALRKLQIESQVTEQFLQLYYNQRSVQIAEEELTNAQNSYEIIQDKVEAGISAVEELYQADLTQANSRASLENGQTRYANAQDNFRILLGLPLDEAIDLEVDIQRALVEVNLDQAVTHGLQNRMELRQRDIEIQYALDDLTQAGAQNEFQASVDLSFGWDGTDERFKDIYRSPTRSQSIALTVNLPLFDWGRKKHSMAASEARVQNSRLNAGEERKQIQYEIRQAYRSVLNQRTQIDIAEKNVKNARLTYEINLERYRNGDLSSKDIEFYQNQLSREQLNEVAALINYQVALLDLKIRSLWDFPANRSVMINSEE